ncbi:MAG: Coq4 family protein [Planctomycetota bacterium]
MLFKRHHNQLHYFHTLKGVLGMLRNPEHTESVFDIEDGLKDIEATQEMVRYLKECRATKAMIEERWLATEDPDLDRLIELPAGSLGHEFARHIRDNGFDPDYFRKIKVRTDADYVMMRVRQTHDIWHMVTGFQTDRIGEVSLKAFELAQLRRPMAAVICSGAVIRFLMKDPEGLSDLLHGISIGYRLGLGSEQFLGQKWEEHWERSITEWREMLGVRLDQFEDEIQKPKPVRPSQQSSGD